MKRSARHIIDDKVKVNRPDNTKADAAIDEIMKRARGVWMRPFIVTEIGVLELSAWQGRIHLGFIGSTKKGQGDGSKLLAIVCQVADEYGLAIDGNIQPNDDSPLDAEQLAAWYERHGFQVDGEEILRPPGGS